MGKLLIGSNLTETKELDRLFQDNGFNESCSRYGECGSVYAYKKLRIDTQNYAISGNDFIVGTGTFIYKNQIDKRALSKILEDFRPEILYSIKSEIIGSFAIFIYKDNNGYFFVDDNHTYNIYYHLEKGKVLLTNTYYHLAKTKREVVTPDELRIIERGFKFSNLWGNTPFSNIRKLMGHEYLLCTNSVWRVCSLKNAKSKTRGNLWKIVSNDYKSINTLFPKSAVFMTGGQDSRLSLAIMLHEGCKPKLCYGSGDSIMTWTKLQDRAIVEQISATFNLEFYNMNWNDSEISLNEEKEYLAKYGELFKIYGCNKNIIKEFEAQLDIDFVSFGYFGECYRTVEGIEYYNRNTFSVQEYLKYIYLDRNLEICYTRFNEFVDMLKEDLFTICNMNGVNIYSLNKDIYQLFELEYRKSADVEMNNFSNLFFYSFPYLGGKKYTDLSMQMDWIDKKDSKVILDGIRFLSPKLLEIPFFSHLKEKTYDPERGILLDKNRGISRGKDKLRKYLKNEKILLLLRKLYHSLTRDEKGIIELNDSYIQKKQLAGILDGCDITKNMNTEKLIELFDLKILIGLIQLDFLVKEVFKS